jgi:ankyrin repeat protein
VIVIKKLILLLVRLFGMQVFFLKKYLLGSKQKFDEALCLGLHPNAKDSSGTPMLHHIVAIGDPEFIAILLKHNADVDIRDSLGRNALYPAIERGYFESLNLLVKANISIEIEDKGGFSPLAWCIIVAVEGKNEVNDLKRSGAIHSMRSLIENGADLNAFGSNQNSPLLLAVHNRDVQLVKLLCELGADGSLKNHSGDSALLMAERNGLEEIKNNLNKASS